MQGLKRSVIFAAGAIWPGGLLILWLMNGRRAEVTDPRSLIGVAALSFAAGVAILVLLASQKVQRLVVQEEAVFRAGRGRFGCAVAVLLLIALVAAYKLRGG